MNENMTEISEELLNHVFEEVLAERREEGLSKFFDKRVPPLITKTYAEAYAMLHV